MRFLRQKYESHAAWLSATTDFLRGLLDENLLKEIATNAIEETLSDELFAARELAFEERLDAKIDKDIKQLAQMKTMQAMGLGKRQVPTTSKPIEQIGPLVDVSAATIVGPSESPGDDATKSSDVPGEAAGEVASQGETKLE